MIALLLLACGDGRGGPPMPPPGPLEMRAATVASTRASCAPYEDVPEVLGVCLAQRVVSLESAADVELLCPSAGAWEAGCRQAWVDEQVRLGRDVPDERLIAACGGNSDCAFQVIDRAPSPDVLVQMTRCETYAVAYQSDCIGHALHRWVNARPTPEQGAAVLAAAGRNARRVSMYHGMSEACGYTLACSGVPEALATDCQTSATLYRQSPARCPAR